MKELLLDRLLMSEKISVKTATLPDSARMVALTGPLVG